MENKNSTNKRSNTIPSDKWEALMRAAEKARKVLESIEERRQQQEENDLRKIRKEILTPGY